MSAVVMVKELSTDHIQRTCCCACGTYIAWSARIFAVVEQLFVKVHCVRLYCQYFSDVYVRARSTHGLRRGEAGGLLPLPSELLASNSTRRKFRF